MTGMVKNQKLPKNILTPTTKAADHDVPVTPDEVWCLVSSCATTYFTVIEVELQTTEMNKEIKCWILPVKETMGE